MNIRLIFLLSCVFQSTAVNPWLRVSPALVSRLFPVVRRSLEFEVYLNWCD